MILRLVSSVAFTGGSRLRAVYDRQGSWPRVDGGYGACEGVASVSGIGDGKRYRGPRRRIEGSRRRRSIRPKRCYRLGFWIRSMSRGCDPYGSLRRSKNRSDMRLSRVLMERCRRRRRAKKASWSLSLPVTPIRGESAQSGEKEGVARTNPSTSHNGAIEKLARIDAFRYIQKRDRSSG